MQNTEKNTEIKVLGLNDIYGKTEGKWCRFSVLKYEYSRKFYRAIK